MGSSGGKYVYLFALLASDEMANGNHICEMGYEAVV